MTKMLVPVDGSASSDKALRFALSMAKGDTEIILLNVQPSYSTPNVRRFLSVEQIQAVQEEESQEVLNHALELTKGSSVRVKTLMRVGDPGKEICGEAAQSAVDCIVMGYRGLGAVKRAILGSVATHVLHETPCPVTIVP